jgi:hypothetical protein
MPRGAAGDGRAFQAGGMHETIHALGGAFFRRRLWPYILALWLNMLA